MLSRSSALSSIDGERPSDELIAASLDEAGAPVNETHHATKKPARAKSKSEKAPLIGDINYDTQVIEGRVLHLYPDVYNRKTNTIESLRAKLQDMGVDSSKLDDQTLSQMLA